MRWLKSCLKYIFIYIACYLPFVVIVQAITGYDYSGAYSAVSIAGAVELLVSGVIKIAETLIEHIIAKKDKTASTIETGDEIDTP